MCLTVKDSRFPVQKILNLLNWHSIVGGNTGMRSTFDHLFSKWPLDFWDIILAECRSSHMPRRDVRYHTLCHEASRLRNFPEITGLAKLEHDMMESKPGENFLTLQCTM